MTVRLSSSCSNGIETVLCYAEALVNHPGVYKKEWVTIASWLSFSAARSWVVFFSGVSGETPSIESRG